MTALVTRLRWLLAATLLGLACAFAAPAAAQSCNDDLQKLSLAREAQLKIINGLVAATHGKQMDPAVFCAKSGGLGASENALLAYMTKNKDWCQIPDQAIAGLQASHAKSVAFSNKACTVAAQIRKMKSQQAEQAKNGGGQSGPQVQPLPTGPL